MDLGGLEVPGERRVLMAPLDDGEVRHGETDFILSVLGEREPGMSGRGGSSFSSFGEGEERKIHC